MKRKIHKKRDLQPVLEQNELSALFNAASNSAKDYSILLLMYDCGLRASEPGLIQINDINFERKQIYIPRLKGSIQSTQDIAAETILALKQWLNQDKNNTIWLYPGRNKKKGITRHQVRWIMQKYAKIVGLSRRAMYPHILKHSRVTHLLEAGLEPTYIQYKVGHREINSTLRYMKLTQATLKRGNQIAENIITQLNKNIL